MFLYKKNTSVYSLLENRLLAISDQGMTPEHIKRAKDIVISTMPSLSTMREALKHRSGMIKFESLPIKRPLIPEDAKRSEERVYYRCYVGLLKHLV